MTAPRTDAGRRLLTMLATEWTASGTRTPRAFDARLTERIVEDFVPRIEEEAAKLGAEIAADIIPPDWQTDAEGYVTEPLVNEGTLRG